MREYYKNTFMLAFYDKRGTLVGLYDNVYDLALALNEEVTNVQTRVSKLVNKQNKTINLNGTMCTLELIPVNDTLTQLSGELKKLCVALGAKGVAKYNNSTIKFYDKNFKTILTLDLTSIEQQIKDLELYRYTI